MSRGSAGFEPLAPTRRSHGSVRWWVRFTSPTKCVAIFGGWEADRQVFIAADGALWLLGYETLYRRPPSLPGRPIARGDGLEPRPLRSWTGRGGPPSTTPPARATATRGTPLETLSTRAREAVFESLKSL